METIRTHQAIHHRTQDKDRPTTSAHYFRFAGHAALASRIDFPLHLRPYTRISLPITSAIVSVAHGKGGGCVTAAQRGCKQACSDGAFSAMCVYACVRMTETRLNGPPSVWVWLLTRVQQEERKSGWDGARAPTFSPRSWVTVFRASFSSSSSSPSSPSISILQPIGAAKTFCSYTDILIKMFLR